MTAPVDYGQRFFEENFVERGCVSTRPMD
jgi:hypothetical protein